MKDQKGNIICCQISLENYIIQHFIMIILSLINQK